LAKQYESKRIYNYGYAASITNCSTETNVTLRYGGTRENYLTYVSTMPSIWSYAKEAGLATVYIDGQRENGVLQNQMTDEELKSIGTFIQFDGVPLEQRDMAIAEKLIGLSRNDTAEFIMVNKIGAHFPVHDKFPDSHAVFKPMLPRGFFTDIGDTGSREGFAGDKDAWLRYRNSYRNTVLWNVGTFFQRLLSAKTRKSVIVYTSDHGQNLHEDGSPGTNSHCSSEPKFIEGMIPIVVIEDKELDTLNWDEHVVQNRNSTSHYNIFPTLLALMSYDTSEIEKIYGTPLSSPSKDLLTFNTNYHARLGEKPRWKKIRTDAVAFPE